MKDHIPEAKQAREEAQKRLQTLKRTERLNEHGIMEGSMLKIQVIEARDLIGKGLGGLSNPYASLSIEKDRFETKYI